MYGVIITSRPTCNVAETIDHVDCIPTRSEAQRIADVWRSKGDNRTAIVYEMLSHI